MPERETPVASGHESREYARCATGDFIPLSEAWENFAAQCESARIPLCTACQRVRCFNVDPDAICARIFDGYRIVGSDVQCLARRNKRERSEP